MNTIEPVKAPARLAIRQRSIRDAMAGLELDALLLTRSADIYYLSHGVVAEGSVGLLTEKEFTIIAGSDAVFDLKKRSPWIKAIPHTGKMVDTILSLVLSDKLVRIGYEGDKIVVAQLSGLSHSLVSVEAHTRVQLLLVGNVMADARKIKDDDEINLLRRSVSLAEESFLAVRSRIQVGMTENYVAGMLEFEMRTRGADDASFSVIVATGPNSALIHPRPSERTIQKDSMVVVDWGARTKGYCSDLTRTLFFGRPPAKIEKAYRVILEARDKAIEYLRPGVMTKDVNRVAADVMDRHGFTLKHGLGHGIGLEVHELPNLSPVLSDEELQAGMVVTIEPGAYISGIGGVRVEDDVLITHAGCEVLSNLERSFEGCRII